MTDENMDKIIRKEIPLEGWLKEVRHPIIFDNSIKSTKNSEIHYLKKYIQIN